MNCDRPPEGWVCSREVGHEGPCAARPTGYRDRLLALLDLPEGWDSYGSRKIDPGTVATVAIFLQEVASGTVSIVPMSSGGVQIEYHGSGVDVEIAFEPRTGAATGEISGLWESVL